MKTLEDISREAGVSISTVSRVLNNSGYASKATKDKVRKAAVGYVPNAIAQSMVGNNRDFNQLYTGIFFYECILFKNIAWYI